MTNKKSAFSLLELVFVLVIVSLIGFVSISFDNNNLLSARDQLIRHIRFTQSLALFDNRFKHQPDSNSTGDIAESKYWFKGMWQLQMQTTANTIFYSVYHDIPTSTGNWNFQTAKSSDEVAIDPETNKFLVGAWKDITASSPWNIFSKDDVNTKLNLSKEFGITKVEFKYNSKTTINSILSNWINIFFDNLGRVYLFPSITGKTRTYTDIHPYKYLLREAVQFKISNSSDSVCFSLESHGYLYISECKF